MSNKNFESPEEQALDIIKEVLTKYLKGKQINLESEAAKDVIAKEIQETLFLVLDIDY